MALPRSIGIIVGDRLAVKKECAKVVVEVGRREGLELLTGGPAGAEANGAAETVVGDSLGTPDRSQRAWDMIYHHPPSVCMFGGRWNSP